MAFNCQKYKFRPNRPGAGENVVFHLPGIVCRFNRFNRFIRIFVYVVYDVRVPIDPMRKLAPILTFKPTAGTIERRPIRAKVSQPFPESCFFVPGTRYTINCLQKIVYKNYFPSVKTSKFQVFSRVRSNLTGRVGSGRVT